MRFPHGLKACYIDVHFSMYIHVLDHYAMSHSIILYRTFL